MQKSTLARAINGSFKKLDEEVEEKQHRAELLEEQNQEVTKLFSDIEERLALVNEQTISAPNHFDKQEFSKKTEQFKKTVRFHNTEWNKYPHTQKRNERTLKNLKTILSDIKKHEYLLEESKEIISTEPSASSHSGNNAGDRPSAKHISELAALLETDGPTYNTATEPLLPPEKNHASFWSCFRCCDSSKNKKSDPRVQCN